MIRKWMTMLLSLMLAVVLPFGALADTQHTLSIVPGDLLASEEAIADLLGILDLRVTEGDQSGALTILLNDQEIVTLGLTADVTGLYASSSLLGAEVLYITWDDAFAVLGDLLTAAMAESGMDDATLQSMETGLSEAKNSIMTALGTGASSTAMVSAPASMDESLEMMKQLFPDDPQMVEYVQELYADMTIEDGTFADENRDTADQKYRMTMDEADLVALCETEYMKNVMLEALMAENPDASDAELSEDVEEALAEMKKLFEESSFEMIMEMYTLDAGQTLVGMDMISNMEIVENEEKATMQMAAEYDRLTDEEGVSYQADGAIAVNGEVAEATFDLYCANNGVSTGMVGMLADGEEIVIKYEAENTAADTRERKADLYLRSGATAILEPAASARPVVGLLVKTEPASEETLAALENANAQNSTDLMKLSEAEMQQLLNGISLNATQALYAALAQLPTSTLNMLMNSGMME